jgi:hypothetical protein
VSSEHHWYLWHRAIVRVYVGDTAHTRTPPALRYEASSQSRRLWWVIPHVMRVSIFWGR